MKNPDTAPELDEDEPVETRFGRFRRWFPWVVFGALALFALLEHLRPSRSELPVFEPAERVALEPVEVPAGEDVLVGTVLADDGRAAANVLVELSREGEPIWTFTAADGSFELRGLDAGRSEVTLVQLDVPPVRRLVTLPSEPVRWTLPAPYEDLPGLPGTRRSSLFGTVTTPLDGSVDGYQLVLEPADSNPDFSSAVLRRVPIKSGGVYAIADLAVGDYLVYVLPPWADGGSWPRLVEADYRHESSSGSLDLELTCGELDGVLLQARDGAPLVGAQVVVWEASDPDRIWEPRTTDESGYFMITDLPPAGYVVEVRAGGVVLREFVRVPSGQRVTTEIGPVALPG